MAQSKTVSNVRELKGITSVSLQDSGSITIRQGAVERLTIRAEPDLLEKLRIETKGSRLVLGIGRDWLERLLSGFDVLRNRVVEFELVVKQLESVLISGKYDVLVEALDAGNLSIHTSGASTIQLTSLTANHLQIDTNGRSEISCSGRVIEQSIRCSGSCDYQAAGLETEQTSIAINGRSEVTVWVEKFLDVSISGMGAVTYRGQPAVTQSISGLGRVQHFEMEGSAK